MFSVGGGGGRGGCNPYDVLVFKGLFPVLTEHNSIAVVVKAAVSNFINAEREKVRGAAC